MVSWIDGAQFSSLCHPDTGILSSNPLLTINFRDCPKELIPPEKFIGFLMDAGNVYLKSQAIPRPVSKLVEMSLAQEHRVEDRSIDNDPA